MFLCVDESMRWAGKIFLRLKGKNFLLASKIPCSICLGDERAEGESAAVVFFVFAHFVVAHFFILILISISWAISLYYFGSKESPPQKKMPHPAF